MYTVTIRVRVDGLDTDSTRQRLAQQYGLDPASTGDKELAFAAAVGHLYCGYSGAEVSDVSVS